MLKSRYKGHQTQGENRRISENSMSQDNFIPKGSNTRNSANTETVASLFHTEVSARVQFLSNTSFSAFVSFVIKV